MRTLILPVAHISLSPICILLSQWLNELARSLGWKMTRLGHRPFIKGPSGEKCRALKAGSYFRTRRLWTGFLFFRRVIRHTYVQIRNGRPTDRPLVRRLIERHESSPLWAKVSLDGRLRKHSTKSTLQGENLIAYNITFFAKNCLKKCEKYLLIWEPLQ